MGNQYYLSSSCNSVEENDLRCSASERHAHPVKQLFCCVQVLLFWKVLSITKALA